MRPNSTRLVAGSFVTHEIWVLAVPMLPAETALMTGGVVSLKTVAETAAEVVQLPAASQARAVKEWAALVRVFVSRENVKGEVVSVLLDVPSIRNSTLVTPTLSEAVAVTFVVPEIVEAAIGAVMETVGAVTSLKTVALTAEDILQFPAASHARAVKA